VTLNESLKLCSTLASFALAGLLSALLQGYTRFHFLGDMGSLLFLGAIFGVALAVCLSIFFGLRSIWKTIILVAASAVAYPVSFLAAGLTYDNILGLSWLRNQAGDIEFQYVFFVGGFAGSFIILAAALFLSYPKLKVRWVFINAACWSVVGGLLGILGATVSNFWLTLVWQAGMACLLALVLSIQQRRNFIDATRS
jgi:hypothetical protein